MKFCPLCNESFSNELNFCDVDGVRLKRQHDATSLHEKSNGLWSLLGVGLLLGALGISAFAILFFPKPGITPSAQNTESTLASGPAPADPQGGVADPAPAATYDVPVVEIDSLPLPEPRTREKLEAETEATAEVDPDIVPQPSVVPPWDDIKSAANPGDKSSASPALPPRSIEPVTEKASSGASSDTSTQKAEPSGSAGKQSKQVSRDSKNSPEKQSDAKNKKKQEEDKKKKKGGFFNAFKKIFGKG